MTGKNFPVLETSQLKKTEKKKVFFFFRNSDLNMREMEFLRQAESNWGRFYFYTPTQKKSRGWGEAIFSRSTFTFSV
jgi:hypothetical protein